MVKNKDLQFYTIKPQIKGIGGCWGLDKKDSFDDINGYTELLRRLVIDENKNN